MFLNLIVFFGVLKCKMICMKITNGSSRIEIISTGLSEMERFSVGVVPYLDILCSSVGPTHEKYWR
jgi:hypothetical protein